MDFKTNITGLQHIGMPTKDIDQTITFYKNLGFEIDYQTLLDEPNRQFRVAFLRLADLLIETYEVPAEANRLAGAINHIALNVKDVEAAFTAARQCGFDFLDTAIDGLPFFEKGVRFFTILGPNGEKVEFNQRM
jgi:lactoylglutathione lyase